jgi:hypothetical protein
MASLAGDPGTFVRAMAIILLLIGCMAAGISMEPQTARHVCGIAAWW